MKILIYGGAFNPVHLAHIKNLKLACEIDNFDKVIIVPNKNSHFKDDNQLATTKQRIDMLKLALEESYENSDFFEISRIEIDSSRRLYTTDVVDIIKEQYLDAELYFLIGSDQAKQLDKWHDIDNLMKKINFIVIRREDDYVSEDLIVVENEVLDYSSTAIREEYKSSGLKSVDKYIRDNGLYLETLLLNYMEASRANHSKNVALLAHEIAGIYNLDANKAYVAGMLHDIAKEMPLDKQYDLIKDDLVFQLHDYTVHAFAGARVVRDVLKIDDDQIFNAIKWHTTAYFKMSQFDKLIYVSDMLSVGRYFAGIEELRKLLYMDLDECFKQCFLSTYKHLKIKDIYINNELEELKIKIERNEV